MAKKDTRSGATAPMFHTYTDLNGVDIACNAHPASDYGTTQRLLDPSVPMARQVANQVYGGSGQRMDFDAHTVDPMKPRNPAGWPTTTDLFPSLLKKGTR